MIKAAFVVGIANGASFVVPYFIYFSSNDFSYMANYWPTYIVGIWYLLLTLAVEVPIVCNLLKKDCDNGKKLFKFVIMTNIVTTLMVAIVERIICVGRW